MTKVLVISRIFVSPYPSELTFLSSNGLPRFIGYYPDEDQLHDIFFQKNASWDNILSQLTHLCNVPSWVCILNGNTLQRRRELIQPIQKLFGSLDIVVLCHPGENNLKKSLVLLPLLPIARENRCLGIYSGEQDAGHLADLIKACSTSEGVQAFESNMLLLREFCYEKIAQGFDNNFSLIKHNIFGLFSGTRIKFQLVAERRQSGESDRADNIFSDLVAGFQSKLKKCSTMLQHSPGVIDWSEVQNVLDQATFDSEWQHWNDNFMTWLDELETAFNNIRSRRDNNE